MPIPPGRWAVAFDDCVVLRNCLTEQWLCHDANGVCSLAHHDAFAPGNLDIARSFPKSLCSGIALDNAKTHPTCSTVLAPRFDGCIERLRVSGSVPVSCNNEGANMPDTFGEQVRDDVTHASQLAACVLIAKDVFVREGPPRRQITVNLLMGFASLRGYAVDGQEVLRVSLEELLQNCFSAVAEIDHRDALSWGCRKVRRVRMLSRVHSFG